MKYFYTISAIIILILILIINDLYTLRNDHEKLKVIMDKHIINLCNTNKKFNDLSIINKKLQKKLLKLEQKVDNSTLIKVNVTYYCPLAGGTNSDSNPNKTALMTTPRPGYTIAVSKDLVDKGWLGHKVYIEGFGIGKIEDRMSRKIKGNCIDICIGTEKEAIQKGKRLNINMVKL